LQGVELLQKNGGFGTRVRRSPQTADGVNHKGCQTIQAVSSSFNKFRAIMDGAVCHLQEIKHGLKLKRLGLCILESK
jgi:hypothetical protein